MGARVCRIRYFSGQQFRHESAAERASVESWTETLIGPVVDAVALAIEVTEFPARSLTIKVLVSRKNRRCVPGVGRRELGTRAIASGTTLLGRDDDDAVRRA